MNTPRSVLRRRGLLRSGSALLLGGFATLRSGRHLLGSRPPEAPSPSPKPQPLMTAKPAAPPPEPADVDEVFERHSYQLHGRHLENEREYADFIFSLDLRHLSPEEIIEPHKEITSEVPNRLPPLEEWERLIPTLRAADELRERLEVPLSRITSAYRAPHYNAIIPGAVSNSYHTRNQALDLIYHCSPRKAYSAALQLRKEGFFRGGVGLYPTFLHLDTRGYAATWRRG